jgi:hypothetical protein
MDKDAEMRVASKEAATLNQLLVINHLLVCALNATEIAISNPAIISPVNSPEKVPLKSFFFARLILQF